MTIEVTIIVNERGKIIVNPDPIKVSWRQIEEIRWRLVESPGWQFKSTKDGITILGKKPEDTFKQPLYSPGMRSFSVIDLNNHVVPVARPKKKGGPAARRKLPRPATFQYTIKLVKKGRTLLRKGRGTKVLMHDPAIENQGC